MFNRIDTFQGYNTKKIPLDKGFLLFNNAQFDSDSAKFRLSRFDECGRIDWSRNYISEELTGNFDPDAIKVNSDTYLLLKSREDSNNPHLLTLVKFNENNTIVYAVNIENEANDLLSHTANILKHTTSNYLYIVSADRKGNTVVMSINPENGGVVNSKLVENIRHGSSEFDDAGNLFVFSSDSVYARLRVNDSRVDSVMWARHIKNRFFAKVNDPLDIRALTGDRMTTVIIDTILRKDTTSAQIGIDTAIYRLIAFNYNGDIVNESPGFVGPDYKIWPVDLKRNTIDRGNIYVMVKNRVGFFTSDLVKTFDGKYYEFQIDSFDVVDASLEICDDVSLIMSGFSYKKLDENLFNLESPYLFVSKTQPFEKGFVVEAEQPVCLPDSVDKQNIQMIATKSEFIEIADSIVEFSAREVEFDRKSVDVTLLNEEYCGKVNMTKIEEEEEFCPGQSYRMQVEWLKGADYLWNTGEKTTFVVKDVPGIYTVTVTLCDTVKVSSFEYILIDDVDACFTVYIPEAFIPGHREDSTYNSFKSFQKRPFPYNEFSLQVFDRWGEKVFETNDSNQPWDGNFRGKPMPAGVYLYRLYWKAIFYDKTYENTYRGQVLLMR
jgi:gliding motility-associated-like protein